MKYSGENKTKIFSLTFFLFMKFSGLFLLRHWIFERAKPVRGFQVNHLSIHQQDSMKALFAAKLLNIFTKFRFKNTTLHKEDT